MDPRTAAVLVGDDGRSALALAAAQADLESFATAARMRQQFDPALAAAALTQESLRRRARTKFGDDAAGLFLTPDGLQQATRPAVARLRAERFVAAGVRRVVDLGCGLGSDALAFAAAGLEVVAVESDPATAILATANASASPNASTSGGLIRVVTGRAEDLAPELLADPATAVFCDPARRDDRGRVWRVEQFSPGWDFVTGLLDGSRVACIKLGPALPHALVPDGVEADWLSHGPDGTRGEVVEVGLWAGPTAEPGARAATRLTTAGIPGVERLVRVGPAPTATVRPIGSHLHEPDGAAIRAGLVGTVAALTGTALVDPQIAYLTGDTAADSPWLTSFAVVEVLPYTEKVLRRWLTDHQVGRLEIKKRGVDVDPATLRKRLKPTGPHELTMLLTRTPDGTRAVMAHRV